MNLSGAAKPNDALTAATRLLELVSESELSAIRAQERWAVDAHFSLGAAIRNAWLHSNPALMADFKAHGVLHPDDASAFLLHVLESFARAGSVDIASMLSDAGAASQWYWQRARGGA